MNLVCCLAGDVGHLPEDLVEELLQGARALKAEDLRRIEDETKQHTV